MNDGGFERGAGISQVSVAMAFELMLVIVLLVAVVMTIIGAWGAWSENQLSTQKLFIYSFRALVLLVVTVVLFGAVL